MNDKRKKAKERKDKQTSAATPLPCQQALDAGNYFAAHRLAKQALQSEAHRIQATEVLARVAVDRAPLLVFAVCLLLIATIAFINLG